MGQRDLLSGRRSAITSSVNLTWTGVTLKEWIEMDCGRSVQRYAEKISSGSFGGAIEMEIFTKIKDMNVHVYERCSGGYRRTSCFDASKETKGTVNILYRRKCHYDSLIIDAMSTI